MQDKDTNTSGNYHSNINYTTGMNNSGTSPDNIILDVKQRDFWTFSNILAYLNYNSVTKYDEEYFGDLYTCLLVWLGEDYIANQPIVPRDIKYYVQDLCRDVDRLIFSGWFSAYNIIKRYELNENIDISFDLLYFKYRDMLQDVYNHAPRCLRTHLDAISCMVMDDEGYIYIPYPQGLDLDTLTYEQLTSNYYYYSSYRLAQAYPELSDKDMSPAVILSQNMGDYINDLPYSLREKCKEVKWENLEITNRAYGKSYKRG